MQYVSCTFLSSRGYAEKLFSSFSLISLRFLQKKREFIYKKVVENNKTLHEYNGSVSKEIQFFIISFVV